MVKNYKLPFASNFTAYIHINKIYAEFPIENIHDVEKYMRQKRKDVYLKKSYEKGIHLHWHLLKIFRQGKIRST